MSAAIDDFLPRRIEYFYAGPVRRLGMTLPGYQREGSMVAMTDAEAEDDAHDLGGVAVLVDE